jgi:hypothetical protein
VMYDQEDGKRWIGNGNQMSVSCGRAHASNLQTLF